MEQGRLKPVWKMTSDEWDALSVDEKMQYPSHNGAGWYHSNFWWCEVSYCHGYRALDEHVLQSLANDGYLQYLDCRWPSDRLRAVGPDGCRKWTIEELPKLCPAMARYYPEFVDEDENGVIPRECKPEGSDDTSNSS